MFKYTKFAKSLVSNSLYEYNLALFKSCCFFLSFFFYSNKLYFINIYLQMVMNKLTFEYEKKNI